MYKSPIDIIYGQMETQIEGEIFHAVQKYGINVDKEELIRALEYDRGQYSKGYADAMDSIVRCKDCVHRKERVCAMPYAGMWVGVALKDNDFCSYGERKDNG
jgi:hypothetical protein